MGKRIKQKKAVSLQTWIVTHTAELVVLFVYGALLTIVAISGVERG